MFDLISTTMFAGATKLRFIFLFSIIFLSQRAASAAQDADKPSVGKYRSCQPTTDCTHLIACPPMGQVPCPEIKLSPFGPRITDPGCEAMTQARVAGVRNCLANKKAVESECETSNKQAKLCAALKNEEIGRCAPDLPEFDRLTEGMRVGWWKSRIPKQIQSSLADQFSASQMKDIIVTDRPEALSPKKFILDAIQNQGWLTAGNIIILPSHTLKATDDCTWIRVLVSGKIVGQLGLDGYCQVLQSQPEFLKAAVAKKSSEIFRIKNLRCQ